LIINCQFYVCFQ